MRHVPTAGPGPAHAAPEPQLATVQHTLPVELSAQCPDAHSMSFVHVSPSACAATHEPDLQKLPFEHSSSIVHVERHAVVPHEYTPQVFVAVLHAPLPSQVETSVSMPPAQLATPHATVVNALWHAKLSVPLHESPHVRSVGVVLHAGWPVFGCPTIAEHVPSLPGTLHASHGAVQVPLQQNPSTQWPDPHSASTAHATPLSFRQRPRVDGDASHE